LCCVVLLASNIRQLLRLKVRENEVLVGFPVEINFRF
jgi:hypothetical protein